MKLSLSTSLKLNLLVLLFVIYMVFSIVSIVIVVIAAVFVNVVTFLEIWYSEYAGRLYFRIQELWPEKTISQ